MNFGTDEELDETGIELTPLIDVVFLLLIFFMISLVNFFIISTAPSS